MGWLDKLLGKQDSGTQAPSPPSSPQIPTSAAQLELLSKFLLATDPEEAAKPYWDAVLGEPVGGLVQRFRKTGVLVDASVENKLAVCFTGPGLKALLKERGLKQAGNKTALIERLLENDALGMQEVTGKLKRWRCSPEVGAAAQAYKDEKKARKTATHTNAFNALKEGRVSDAVQSIIELERTQVFARGMGIDWHSATAPERMEAQVESVMKCTPSILKGVPEDEMPMFRAVAAMHAISGESRSSVWLPDDMKGHPTLDPETVVRMIVFAGSHKERLKQMQRSSIKEVTIEHLGLNSCEACRIFGDRRFTLAEAPELPHPGCTHELGCRCGYRPILPWDDE